MKCVIPGGNVKILARAIHTLAKIGEEMYVNPQKESISFRTANMARSAYSDFTFHKNFFSYYVLGDLEEEEAQKCKISMRSAMTVFKSAHTLDKLVETCHIHLEVEACNLVFILKYKNGVNKSHLTPILDSEKLQASFTKVGMSNELVSQARTLMDALHNFPQSLIEITLEITPHKLLFRNYVDDASVMINTTRTQLALGIGEFDHYTIGNETNVTFCLKEVRALLAFSESVGVPITTSFGTAGRPILFTLKSQAFEINLLLATLSPDDCDSQSNSTIASRQVRSLRKKNASSRSTSKRVNKSLSRTKKSVKPEVNDVLKNRPAEERNKSDRTLDQNGNASMNVVCAKANNSINSVQERNLPERSRHSVTFSSAGTSLATDRRISESQRKLVNSVFSNITKRKSTNDENYKKGKEDAIDCIDLKESVPQSPPRQVAKRARLVFQKCFQNTFDPRMLPGHDTILVEDSDENNSD